MLKLDYPLLSPSLLRVPTPFSFSGSSLKTVIMISHHVIYMKIVDEAGNEDKYKRTVG